MARHCDARRRILDCGDCDPGAGAAVDVVDVARIERSEIRETFLHQTPFPGFAGAQPGLPGYEVRYTFAFGDLVRSMAGHCSETAGSGVSLPVMRSGAMA